MFAYALHNVVAIVAIRYIMDQYVILETMKLFSYLSEMTVLNLFAHCLALLKHLVIAAAA